MAKTIVAVGCSHVFGSYLNANDLNFSGECHNRSWVHKVQQGYFADGTSVNLGMPGGSNKRSLRVIKEYVLNNLENTKDMIVFFGITDSSRLELVSSDDIAGFAVDFLANKNFKVYAAGPWSRLPDNHLQTYLDIHYGVFHNDEHENEQTSMDMLTLHLFLKHFGIEHYFVNVLSPWEMFNNNKSMWDRLPLINFGNIVEFARSNGYKVGRDVNPDIDCNHLDHDGNQFLADKIYEQMKVIKKWNTI